MPPSAPTAYSMPSAGRTSMPSTLPAMPVMFQVFTTFFWLVSTIAMVLSPVSAATSAAEAADAVMMSAVEAARMDLMVMAELPVRCRPNATTRGVRTGPSWADAAGRSTKCEEAVHPFHRPAAYP